MSAASKVASAAVREASKNASQLAGGSGALAALGTTVVVSGRGYVVESLLAEGGFGSVYTVLPEEIVRAQGEGAEISGASLSSKKLVLKKMFAGSPELVQQLSTEVTLMKELSGHPNIVKVLGSEMRRQGEGAEILVLMEMCPGGHLLSRINQLKESKRTLTMGKIFEVFIQIVRPVAHMHSFEPPVTHRDLKVREIPPLKANHYLLHTAN